VDTKTIKKSDLISYNFDTINKLYNFAILKSIGTKYLPFEHFAKSVATHCLQSKPNKSAYTILIGNNYTGHIGVLVAKYLSLVSSINITMILTTEIDAFPDYMTRQIKGLQKLGGTLFNLDTSLLNDLLDKIYSADIVIDALIGIDTNKSLQEPITDLIEFTNNSKAHKLSINLPSGINPSTGDTYNISVKADTTIVGEIPTHGVLKIAGDLYLSNLYIKQKLLDKFKIKSLVKKTLQELIKII